MKKRIITIISIFFLITMCVGCKYNKINKNKQMDFTIENNKFLIVEYNSNIYYVVNEKNTKDKENTSYIEKNAYITKDIDDGKLTISYDIPKNKVDIAVIYNVDLKNKTVSINGINYKMITEKEDWNENKLDLNIFFEDRFDDIELNPNNVNEFIDKSGNILKLGSEVNRKDVLYMISLVKLNGKIIETVSYNVDSGKIYGKKELSLILTDQKEASKIKTIIYKGIYKSSDGGITVLKNGKYFKLIK